MMKTVNRYSSTSEEHPHSEYMTVKTEEDIYDE